MQLSNTDTSAVDTTAEQMNSIMSEIDGDADGLIKADMDLGANVTPNARTTNLEILALGRRALGIAHKLAEHQVPDVAPEQQPEIVKQLRDKLQQCATHYDTLRLKQEQENRTTGEIQIDV